MGDLANSEPPRRANGVGGANRDGANNIGGPMTAEHVYALIEALTLLCRELATVIAKREGVGRIEIYRRLAALYVED